MKRIFTLLVEFSILLIQKGYAFQRATIPGNIPRTTLDESGKVIEAPVKMMNTYFIMFYRR